MEKIRKLVFECLRDNEKARNSDWILFRDVCSRKGIDITNISVKDMCENPKDFPSYESVSRARRKVQELGFFLATEKVQKHRNIKECEYHRIYGYN